MPYDLLEYSPEIRSANGVADAHGLPRHTVYKTLVVVRHDGRPLLVMVPGDSELDLKSFARAVGAKRLAMATHDEAEALTGLQTGGISALALVDRPFDVYLDAKARDLDAIAVSAGRRGLNLRLAPCDLVRVTGARYLVGISR